MQILVISARYFLLWIWHQDHSLKQMYYSSALSNHIWWFFRFLIDASHLCSKPPLGGGKNSVPKGAQAFSKFGSVILKTPCLALLETRMVYTLFKEWCASPPINKYLSYLFVTNRWPKNCQGLAKHDILATLNDIFW